MVVQLADVAIPDRCSRRYYGFEALRVLTGQHWRFMNLKTITGRRAPIVTAVTADGPAGAKNMAQVWAITGIHRRWHGDDEKVGAVNAGGIGGYFKGRALKGG